MGFSMDFPDMDDVKEEVKEEVKPAPEVQARAEKAADSNTQELFDFDLGSLQERRQIVTSIDIFGNDLVEKSTKKNELLNVRLVDLSKMGGENGEVVSGLSKLQVQMKDLDPSGIDFTKRSALGKLFNPIKTYFAKFEKE